MKILLLTGNHPRHLYLADSLSNLGLEIIWVIEKIQAFVPKPEKDLSEDIKKLFELHFKKREIAENNFFGKNSGSFAKGKINSINEINNEDLTNGTLKKFCLSSKPDLLLGYGSYKIPNDILEIPNMKKWNVHLGFSPWYRGVATHFWPSYLLEPEFTGITVHEMTDVIDGGPIIHQQLASLNENDGIHENACRLQKSFCDIFPQKLLKNLKINNDFIGIKQHTSGRNFTAKLWKPEMLKIIYNLFDDQINRFCMKNRILRKPILRTILK